MNRQYPKAVMHIVIPMALLFTKQVNAQSGIRGWDIKENYEFTVNGVQTKIKVGQIGTINRDVGCDCDLLQKGKRKDGKDVIYFTPAFFAQFNAESQKTWESLPANVRQVLEKSRTDIALSNIVRHLLFHTFQYHRQKHEARPPIFVMVCGRYFLVGIFAFLISPFCLGWGKQAPSLLLVCRSCQKRR